MAHDGGFSSGVPKMLDAILFFLTGCSVGSSKPNEKLDPPPGGRKTLGITTRHQFHTETLPGKNVVKYLSLHSPRPFLPRSLPQKNAANGEEELMPWGPGSALDAKM